MPKIDQWRDIFRYTGKHKNPVRVGEKYEQMTGTQAYRFEELSRLRRPDLELEGDTPPKKKSNDT